MRRAACCAPAIVWLDQRRATRVPPLSAFWRVALRAAGAAGTVRYFQREAEVNWWAENEPAVWARADKVLLVSGLLNWKLTGRFVDSVASQVGYLPFDFKRHAWAGSGDWKWQALAVRREQLPELLPAGTVLGEVSAEAANATGLARGLPVIAAAADKACEVLGSGCIDDHVGALSYGTTATVNVCTSRYRRAVRRSCRRIPRRCPAASPARCRSTAATGWCAGSRSSSATASSRPRAPPASRPRACSTRSSPPFRPARWA